MAECLQPLLMFNPHYKKYPWKLDASVQMPHDLYLKVPCEKCIHCRRRRASDWRVRLMHEISYGYRRSKRFHAEFVTFTISNEYYEEFRDNPQRAIRLFLERFRKKYKRSLRHWFVTELGDETARLHFHGIIIDYPFYINPLDFARRVNPPSLIGKPIPGTNKKYGKYGAFINPNGRIKKYVEHLKSIWQYGHVWVDTVRFETVNYIVKYLTKDPDVQQREEFADDEFVQNFKPRVFSTPGIGKCYVDDPVVQQHHLSQKDGVWFIEIEKVGGSPYKVPLPRYYVKKLFSDAFRRRLSKARWLSPLRFCRYLKGFKYTNEKNYRTVMSSILSDSVLRGKSKLRCFYGIFQLPYSYILRWLCAASSLSRQYFDAVIRTLSMCEKRPIEYYDYIYLDYGFTPPISS